MVQAGKMAVRAKVSTLHFLVAAVLAGTPARAPLDHGREDGRSGLSLVPVADAVRADRVDLDGLGRGYLVNAAAGAENSGHDGQSLRCGVA